MIVRLYNLLVNVFLFWHPFPKHRAHMDSFCSWTFNNVNNFSLGSKFSDFVRVQKVDYFLLSLKFGYFGNLWHFDTTFDIFGCRLCRRFTFKLSGLLLILTVARYLSLELIHGEWERKFFETFFDNFPIGVLRFTDRQIFFYVLLWLFLLLLFNIVVFSLLSFLTFVLDLI